MCVLGVFRGIPAGFGGCGQMGLGLGLGLGYSLLGWGLFLFFFGVFVLVLGSGLVISHCVMISRCSLPGGLRRRTFGYPCSRGYQFIEIPFWADHFLLSQVFA